MGATVGVSQSGLFDERAVHGRAQCRMPEATRRLSLKGGVLSRKTSEAPTELSF